jgi:EF hand
MRRIGWRARSATKERTMISGISGGGMPSMDAMRQMQQKMFNKADADASGGLDATEFEQAMKNSPMGGQGPAGMSAADAFKKIDGDGNGQVSQTEMEDAHQQMMERFQSTMQAFGQGSSTPSVPSQDTWQTLLQSIGNGDEPSESGRAASKTDELVAQLRSLIDKVSSTYSSSSPGQSAGMLFSA